MDVAMATKVSVAPGIAPRSAQMSIESPPSTIGQFLILGKFALICITGSFAIIVRNVRKREISRRVATLST